MKPTKAINEFQGTEFLREHGIIPLTGEADGLSMRILCDLDERGVAILDSFFGGVTFTAGGWNWGVKSVLLTRAIMIDLIPFLLFWDGAKCVVRLSPKEWKGESHYLAYSEVALWEDLQQYHNIYNVWTWTNTATGRDFRNVHEMSGRTR